MKLGTNSLDNGLKLKVNFIKKASSSRRFGFFF